MQKVSKQSLAMIALSILLAISIALTFTFAALTASKTATGTITFQGEASVTWTGGTADTEAGSVKFTLTNKDFDVTSTGATLNATGKAVLAGIKVTITNSATTQLNYSITMPTVSGATITSADIEGTVASGDENSGTVEKNLGDFISNITFTTAQMDAKVTFVVTASVAPANA